jgi:hypothetical protein
MPKMCVQTYYLFTPSRPTGSLYTCGHCELKSISLCHGRNRNTLQDCPYYENRFDYVTKYCGFCTIMRRFAMDDEEEEVTKAGAAREMDELLECGCRRASQLIEELS